MANDTIHIDNVLTGEVIIHELTDAEQAKLDAQRLAAKQAAEAEKAAAENNRQLKMAAYKKLGLTDAEIEALLPTPTIEHNG